MKNGSSHFGSWAFLIGVILAVVLTLFNVWNTTWLLILVVIGLIVGLLNITEREVHHFLMSGAVLTIVAALGQDVMSGIPILARMLDALLAIFVPATILVAVKNVFTLARR